MGNAPGQRVARARLLLTQPPVVAGLAEGTVHKGLPSPSLPVIVGKVPVEPDVEQRSQMGRCRHGQCPGLGSVKRSHRG